MKIENFKTFEYCCQDTQELLTLLLVCPEELTIDERSEVTMHLSECPVCREDYEGMLQTSEALIANRDYLRNSDVFGKTQIERDFVQMSHEEIMDQRFQDRLERTLIRRKRREHKERIAKIKRIAKPVSAVAACLVIGFGLFFATNQLKDSQNISSPMASVQQQNPVKIELISDNTTEFIPAGELIAASNELKTLRINGNRQMVLNVGTQLSIEPYSLGCVVKLAKGEIYTEVEHDGKPFMVETSYGRAVITGTSFNIKADDGKMDLAVMEGSVRFESKTGTANVKGGYQSSITASMRPTKPAACDVVQITKWVQNQGAEVAKLNVPIKTNISELAELPLAHMLYCDLEDINFDIWIDQHRVWFEREFPWTKRLQKLLVHERIEVDTINLLLESGDLWRFAWPEYSSQRVLAEDKEVIQKISSQYGVEINKLILTGAFAEREISNIEGFNGWLDSFEKGNVNLIDSIHAATFLVNTRLLVWYAIQADKIHVQDKQKCLTLLIEQVKAASNTLERLNRLLIMDNNETACSEVQYDEHIEMLRDGISSMIEIEKELVGHEISSQ